MNMNNEIINKGLDMCQDVKLLTNQLFIMS